MRSKCTDADTYHKCANMHGESKFRGIASWYGANTCAWTSSGTPSDYSAPTYTCSCAAGFSGANCEVGTTSTNTSSSTNTSTVTNAPVVCEDDPTYYKQVGAEGIGQAMRYYCDKTVQVSTGATVAGLGSWITHDCTDPTALTGYSTAERAELLQKCPMACGVGGWADSSGSSSVCSSRPEYAFEVLHAQRECCAGTMGQVCDSTGVAGALGEVVSTQFSDFVSL